MLSDVPPSITSTHSDATVARLPICLRVFDRQLENEVRISSDELATLAAVNAAKFAKPVSMGVTAPGVSGTTSNISFTKFGELGLDHEWSIVIVGAGHQARLSAATEASQKRLLH